MSALSRSPSMHHKSLIWREVAEMPHLPYYSITGNVPLTPPGAQSLHRQMLSDAVTSALSQCTLVHHKKSGEKSALSRGLSSAPQKFNMVREVAEIPSLLSHSTTGNVPLTQPGAQY